MCLSEEDLRVGNELICVHSGDRLLHTVGDIYVVLESGLISTAHWPYTISCDGDRAYIFNLEELNQDSTEPSFVPVSSLSKREQFTFRVSGKLPERYKHYEI